MKNNHLLIQFIKNTYPISDYAAALIADNFERITYTKHTLMLKEGKINSDYLYLESGYMRSYVLDTEGNEVTTNIFKPNQMVFEVASYFQRKPSKENIETITECTAWGGKYESFQKLFHSLPEFREFGRAVLVKGFISFKERTISMITEKAEQRYEKLLSESPDILQYVPLKYIASYLGITDSSLSRLRKDFLRK
ncbi:Crp/Fnr family transcriptional regulator [Thermoflexibacter ruber]|uniref:cAMP-binding domain of CRP or a regulatory subunit of cAMP-dependent protein kinases n=1 Tax=Thermoflexibacter ruber TaxID=1003 RepID=A0A1I2EJR2_9BACT|nr:Crp/Fnr family transcriptional regulator [Thermoflexibacter ruber]SFE92867.1 cAMP-binding domain of CRP or a regulatory subunit of cAMP-dependent protein kinases [Thermoflexibacter ruber]